MYGSWDIEHNKQNFLSFRTIFCPFTHFNNSENQNFEKMKKTPEGIIILNMSTTNENHIMYDSWDMEHDRQNFFRILDHFLPFYTAFSSPPIPPYNPETQRIKILKKWKKHLEISSFYTSVT